MGAQALERFVIGLLIFALVILAVSMAQGIGDSFGHGLITEISGR